jgi:hypothetical protein
MDDFNDDNAKIDAALAALAEGPTVLTGSYTGTGQATDLAVDLGVKAKLVLVGGDFGSDGSAFYQSVTAAENFQYAVMGGGGSRASSSYLVALTDSGFTIQGNSTNAQYGLNRSGKTYYYLAIC